MEPKSYAIGMLITLIVSILGSVLYDKVIVIFGLEILFAISALLACVCVIFGKQIKSCLSARVDADHSAALSALIMLLSLPVILIARLLGFTVMGAIGFLMLFSPVISYTMIAILLENKENISLFSALAILFLFVPVALLGFLFLI